MARRTAGMPPAVAALVWQCWLQAAAFRRDRQPTSCSDCMARCSAMVSTMDFIPPNEARCTVFSSWPTHTRCSAHVASIWTFCTEGCVSKTFSRISMPFNAAISSCAVGPRFAMSYSTVHPRSCTVGCAMSAIIVFRMPSADSFAGANVLVSQALPSGRCRRCLCCSPDRNRRLPPANRGARAESVWWRPVFRCLVEPADVESAAAGSTKWPWAPILR
mmetsp:Transcript_51776/g.116567  ORF Transcript_51776/g.116567 Transcript_51776/m.116567 type:complete len:218 (-) Transcript_51776:66-719(-)